MTPRLGRPHLRRYAGRFSVPVASADAPVTVTFLGVSTLLVDGGDSALMTDGYFSRPGLARVLVTGLSPHQARISAALRRAGVDRLDAVLPVHTHFDHALDSATVAARTGATLVGGESCANLGRGQGLSPSSISVVTPGMVSSLGAFTVKHVLSAHCPPDRFPGAIEQPVVPPARATAYRCGEAWSLLVSHQPSGRRLLVQGSAGFVREALTGERAEVVYLGVGQLGRQDEGYIRTYWDETVRAVGARRVVLVHWDDFFRPLDRPLRALPRLGDDLDATMAVLTPLAGADGVELRLPRVWVREDPWAGMP